MINTTGSEVICIKEELHLDEFLSPLLEEWKTPGISVVILKDNNIVYTGGFGYRDTKNNLKMTAHTIHPIASCTKSFTSTAIAILVDEGKLEWDTPIQKFIPKFSLHDPFIANRVTIKDMLSHQTGLPRHDFVWMNNGFTYNHILDRLPFLELNKDIRQAFQYCNLMYLAASVIIEELSGITYNEFIQTYIFDPLNMNNANFSITDMQKTSDFAKPYKEEDGNVVECEFVNNDVAAGAGCINAGIGDMGKWLQFHLNLGKSNGNQVVSCDNLKKTHTPVVVVSTGSDLDYWLPDQKWIKFRTYALGWDNIMYRGHRVVTHEGGIDGSTSKMSFVPDEGLGVGVIVNKSDSFLPPVVTYHVLDRLLELEPVDWNNLLTPIDDETKKITRESGAKSQELRIQGTTPSHSLEEYTGKYHHPGYGDINIVCKEGELTADLGGINCPLQHYHYNTFQIEYNRFDWKELLTFQVDASGDIAGFTIKLEALVAPITFDRLPDKRLKDKEFLEILTGTYEMAGITIKIACKENAITMGLPNESARELVPVRGLRFKIKDSEAATLTFKQDKSGAVSEFLFSQAGTVISAKRVK
ncbi:MAG: serine hydrolase [Candidatus Methanofastidiosia archaeon]|jgi:CubicO group peptidase (beta-lactamase class C family)